MFWPIRRTTTIISLFSEIYSKNNANIMKRVNQPESCVKLGVLLQLLEGSNLALSLKGTGAVFT